MTGNSERTGVRKGTLQDLWVIFETTTRESGENEEFYDDMSFYSELSFESSSESGGGTNPRGTSKRSPCKRVNASSPPHRSKFEAQKKCLVDESKTNDLSTPIGLNVGDRWSPIEGGGKSVPKGKSYERKTSEPKSGLTGDSPMPVKLDHCPRIPNRRVSDGLTETPNDGARVI